MATTAGAYDCDGMCDGSSEWDTLMIEKDVLSDKVIGTYGLCTAETVYAPKV